MLIRKKHIRTIFFLFWLMSLFSGFGCGYKFSGGGDLPAGIKSICVTVFENRTFETGIENIITNALIYEFTRDGKITVTGKDGADAVLSGVIDSISAGTISHRGEYTSVERRVKMMVDLKLTHKDGRIIWTAKGVSENEAYQVTSDKVSTQHNKLNAISVLSKRLAEKVYYSLTDNF